MKRTFCALLTAAGLCLTLAVLPAPASAFTDVSGDTAEAVEVLYSLGIVSGYSDGAYHPSDGLTRAQFCKLAVLAEGPRRPGDGERLPHPLFRRDRQSLGGPLHQPGL